MNTSGWDALFLYVDDWAECIPLVSDPPPTFEKLAALAACLEIEAPEGPRRWVYHQLLIPPGGYPK